MKKFFLLVTVIFVAFLGLSVGLLLLLAQFKHSVPAFFHNEKSNQASNTEPQPLANTNRPDTPVTQEEKARWVENTKPFIIDHTPLVKTLLGDLTGKEKASRFLDLFAPLGVLDPYANEAGNNQEKEHETISIQNVEFGYFSQMAGFSETQSKDLVQSPLHYASGSFDYRDYFQQNHQKLALLQSTTTDLPTLKIIAYWSSGLTRINQTFGDYKHKLIWHLDQPNGLFYDFSNVTLHSVNEPRSVVNQDTVSIQGLDTKKMDILLETIPTINVTTIYKCNGKTIYILGATTNNAFGFIYGAKDSSEVNCGYLSNRFEIMKDEKLDENWRFWIGR